MWIFKHLKVSPELKMIETSQKLKFPGTSAFQNGDMVVIEAINLGRIGYISALNMEAERWYCEVYKLPVLLAWPVKSVSVVLTC